MATMSEQVLSDRQKSMSADDAIQALKDGNKRYLAKDFADRDHAERVAATKKGQFPYAAVLSCIDSRVPAEIVFDLGISDIFSSRVAGNVVDTHTLGSLEYAVKYAGSKLIVVLGHTGCGAVKGACDNLVDGVNLTGLMAAILPAVKATESGEGEERNSGNGTFVNNVVNTNVNLTIAEMLRRSPIIKGLVDAGTIKVVGAVYDVTSGEVTFM